MATKPRWVSFALSVLVHLAGMFLLVGAATVFPPDSSAVQRILMPPKEAPQQNKIVWYDFRSSLPEIAPAERFGPGKKPQGKKDPESWTVIAHSPKRSSSKQFIWQPDRPQPIQADVPTPNLVAVQPPPPKPALKQFSAPPPPPPPPGKPQTLALVEPSPAVEAPKLPLAAGALGAELAKQIPDSLPRRPTFVPPSQSSRSTGTGSALNLPDAPSSLANGTAGASGDGLKAVIVGLDPAPGPSPPGSRPGEFSRAPTAGPPSSGAVSQSGAPSVPGLMAHATPGVPVVILAPDPTKATLPERRMLKDLVLPSINRTMSAPLRPSSRIIPASVESRFAGRDVYTLVIPVPALAEYAGDWILWFSERHPPQDRSGRVLAPIPNRKYYLTGASTPREPLENATVQLTSIIDRSGKVTNAKVLRGGSTGEAFRDKAVEELESWEFQPALRNGEPVDVDVVLEISFRFRPDLPAR